MKHMVGTPHTLKEVNLCAVRKVIREQGSATRAEIAAATKISVTTVRTLLTEMAENGELLESGYDESMGGRKAVRYALNKDRFFGAALCVSETELRYFTVNTCGEVSNFGLYVVTQGLDEAIRTVLDDLFGRVEIRSIGLGVPGVATRDGYQQMCPGHELTEHPIAVPVRERYGVPVLLENDLNAIVMGFGRCYLSSFPDERCEDVNMAYLHFERCCLSAGFLSGGRLLRGSHNFVGELGLFPVSEDKTLDELLSSPLSDEEYAALVAKLLCMLCCVLNPQYIAMGGDGFRKGCLPLIQEYFDATLPRPMSAELISADERWHDYYAGLGYLTAEQIFADVRLVQA